MASFDLSKNSQLSDFASWLEHDLTHFESLVLEGSVVTGDPWQEGLSDYDLNVIVRSDQRSEARAIYAHLEQHPLGDEYLVGVRLSNDFLHGDSLNDISLKFRSASIAGTDAVSLKFEPSRSRAREIGLDGLRALLVRFNRRWLNLAHWSTEYAQHKNYELFKNYFVFHAALHYGKTGRYPVRRSDVAAVIADQTCAQNMLKVVNNMLSTPKTDQAAAMQLAISEIEHTLGELSV